MFRQSGFSIAIGNASPEVKHLADVVTLSNDQDGRVLDIAIAGRAPVLATLNRPACGDRRAAGC
jgi:hypothetical protein